MVSETEYLVDLLESNWNDAMIATLNKYKAGDYSDQYDIISSTLN